LHPKWKKHQLNATNKLRNQQNRLSELECQTKVDKLFNLSQHQLQSMTMKQAKSKTVVTVKN
jgi:hypothetical protein